jgi:hypothetical protein
MSMSATSKGNTLMTVVREYFSPSGRIYRLSRHLTRLVYSVIDASGVETFPQIGRDDPRSVLLRDLDRDLNACRGECLS